MSVRSHPWLDVATTAVVIVLALVWTALALVVGVVAYLLGTRTFTFDAELWLANALLAVTFPFLAFYGDYFQLWPFAKPPAADADAESGTDPQDQLTDAAP